MKWMIKVGDPIVNKLPSYEGITDAEHNYFRPDSDHFSNNHFRIQ